MVPSVDVPEVGLFASAPAGAAAEARADDPDGRGDPRRGVVAGLWSRLSLRQGMSFVMGQPDKQCPWMFLFKEKKLRRGMVL